MRLWLPPSYGSAYRRYPVIYAQDGQRVFENGGVGASWNGMRRLNNLAEQGIEAILVGTDSEEASRVDDYSPFVDGEHGGGNGDRYVAFLTETLKPHMDAEFFTRPEPEFTTLVGSSLGALISLYALLHRPDVFGSAIALSPSVSFAGGALARAVENAPVAPARVYLDAGTREFDAIGPYASREYLGRVRALRDTLLARTSRNGLQLAYREIPGGRHDESSWGERLGLALRLLSVDEQH